MPYSVAACQQMPEERKDQLNGLDMLREYILIHPCISLHLICILVCQSPPFTPKNGPPLRVVHDVKVEWSSCFYYLQIFR